MTIIISPRRTTLTHDFYHNSITSINNFIIRLDYLRIPYKIAIERNRKNILKEISASSQV